LRPHRPVEHYEITRYGSLIAWAKQLGRSDCASVPQQNLDEENATDKKLTSMAESKVNRQAAWPKLNLEADYGSPAPRAIRRSQGMSSGVLTIRHQQHLSCNCLTRRRPVLSILSLYLPGRKARKGPAVV
jgi:hypothetical protein